MWSGLDWSGLHGIYIAGSAKQARVGEAGVSPNSSFVRQHLCSFVSFAPCRCCVRPCGLFSRRPMPAVANWGRNGFLECRSEASWTHGSEHDQSTLPSSLEKNLHREASRVWGCEPVGPGLRGTLKDGLATQAVARGTDVCPTSSCVRRSTPPRCVGNAASLQTSGPLFPLCDQVSSTCVSGEGKSLRICLS